MAVALSNTYFTGSDGFVIGKAAWTKDDAYAYVFWKHTLLQTDHFYKSVKENIANTQKGIGAEIATQLVERYIIDLKNRLFDQTNFKKIDNRKMFHWIMNRVTTEICLNYFYQWKDIAQANSEGVKVPDWVQVNKMLEKSRR